MKLCVKEYRKYVIYLFRGHLIAATRTRKRTTLAKHTFLMYNYKYSDFFSLIGAPIILGGILGETDKYYDGKLISTQNPRPNILEDFIKEATNEADIVTYVENFQEPREGKNYKDLIGIFVMQARKNDVP